MMGIQKGFTVIEVMLFLAISAMLFLIAFGYMSTTMQNTNFTDDSTQIHSFLQRQYLTVKNSETTADSDALRKCDTASPTQVASAPGASNDCMVIGKVLYFNKADSTIDISTVVGNANFTAGSSELDTLRSLQPRVISNGLDVVQDERYPMPSRLSFSQGSYKVSAATQPFDVIVFLRSPLSQNIYAITWSVAPNGKSAASYNAAGGIMSKLTPVSGVYASVDKPALLCFVEDGATDRRAAIEIPSGQAAGKIIKTITSKNTVLSVGMSCL